MTGRFGMGGMSAGVSALALLTIVACAGVGRSEAAPAPAQEASALLAGISLDDPAGAVARFDALAALATVAPPSPNADLVALRSALPEGMTLTWASEQTRPDGALVATDVRLTGEEGISLRADTLRLWGFDGPALSARLRGERTGERVAIFSRMEAEGLRVDGLEDAMTQANEAMQDEMLDGMGELLGTPGMADAAAPDATIDDYDFSIARVAMGSLTLRPVMSAPETGNATETGALGGYVEFWRVPELDWASLSGLTLAFGMTTLDPTLDMEMSMSANYAMERYDLAGMRGGDLDFWQMGAMAASGSMTFPGQTEAGTETDAAPLAPLAFSVGIDSAVGGGGRLDRAYELLALQQWPDRAETGFLSLGKAQFNGLSFDFGDTTVLKADRFIFDASGWHGLIPTAIDLRAQGVNWDILGYIEEIAEIMPTFTATGSEDMAPIPADELAMMLSVIDALRPVFTQEGYDEAYAWRWDPATGAASLTAKGDYRGWFGADIALTGTLASHDAMWPVDAETPYAGLSDALKASGAFSGFNVTLTELGGIDRTLRATIAVANALPESEETAFLKDATPDMLRSFAYGGLGMLAMEAGKEFPPARDFVITAANWLRDGGVLGVKMAPATPLGAQAAAELSTGEIAADPQKLVDFLGLSVTHVAPVDPNAVPADPAVPAQP